jgi:hypothetical protein
MQQHQVCLEAAGILHQDERCQTRATPRTDNRRRDAVAFCLHARLVHIQPTISQQHCRATLPSPHQPGAWPGPNWPSRQAIKRLVASMQWIIRALMGCILLASDIALDVYDWFAHGTTRAVTLEHTRIIFTCLSTKSIRGPIMLASGPLKCISRGSWYVML